MLLLYGVKRYFERTEWRLDLFLHVGCHKSMTGAERVYMSTEEGQQQQQQQQHQRMR